MCDTPFIITTQSGNVKVNVPDHPIEPKETDMSHTMIQSLFARTHTLPQAVESAVMASPVMASPRLDSRTKAKLALTYDLTGLVSVDEILAHTSTNFVPTLKVPAIGHAVIPGWRAVVREDTGSVFGFVSPKYQPNRHIDHMMAVDPLVRSGDLRPVNASVWGGGAMIAYQFEAPALTAMVGTSDNVSPLLTLAFRNDGQGGDRSFFSAFRFFCLNQMGQVGKISASVRHGAGIIGNYADALMNSVRQLQADMPAQFQAYKKLATCQRRLSNTETIEYFGKVFEFDGIEVLERLNKDEKVTAGHVKALDGLTQALEQERRMPGVSDVWSAYNAVTRYTTHAIGRSEALRTQRAIFDNGKVYTRALDAAVALTGGL